MGTYSFIACDTEQRGAWGGREAIQENMYFSRPFSFPPHSVFYLFWNSRGMMTDCNINLLLVLFFTDGELAPHVPRAFYGDRVFVLRSPRYQDFYRFDGQHGSVG